MYHRLKYKQDNKTSRRKHRRKSLCHWLGKNSSETSKEHSIKKNKKVNWTASS